MQLQPVPPHAGKVALRSGATLGIILGIIHSIIVITNTVQSANSSGYGGPNASSVLLYLVTPLVWIVGLLIAGGWGSKTTGKVSTGTIAGLFAGLFGGIVAGFGQAIATTLSVNISGAASGNASSQLALGFLTIFYVLALTIGAGAGLGALGGLIGQTVSDVRPQPSMPQPVPQPAQPIYQPPVVPYGYMQVPVSQQQEQPQVTRFPDQ